MFRNLPYDITINNEFSHRVAFVPEEILERLMFEIPTKAEEILENEGY